MFKLSTPWSCWPVGVGVGVNESKARMKFWKKGCVFQEADKSSVVESWKDSDMERWGVEE